MSIAPELGIECLIALERRVHAHAAAMTFITREGLKRLDPIERLFHYSNRGVAFKAPLQWLRSIYGHKKHYRSL